MIFAIIQPCAETTKSFVCSLGSWGGSSRSTECRNRGRMCWHLVWWGVDLYERIPTIRAIEVVFSSKAEAERVRSFFCPGKTHSARFEVAMLLEVPAFGFWGTSTGQLLVLGSGKPESHIFGRSTSFSTQTSLRGQIRGIRHAATVAGLGLVEGMQIQLLGRWTSTARRGRQRSLCITSS